MPSQKASTERQVIAALEARVCGLIDSGAEDRRQLEVDIEQMRTEFDLLRAHCKTLTRSLKCIRALAANAKGTDECPCGEIFHWVEEALRPITP